MSQVLLSLWHVLALVLLADFTSNSAADGRFGQYLWAKRTGGDFMALWCCLMVGYWSVIRFRL